MFEILDFVQKAIENQQKVIKQVYIPGIMLEIFLTVAWECIIECQSQTGRRLNNHQEWI